MVDNSGDWKTGVYLGRRLSIAIQHGNAVSLLGTLPHESNENNFFDASS